MIKGKKVDLVAVSMDYLELYHKWINDPAVSEFLATRAMPFSMNDERTWVERNQNTDGMTITYTVTTKKGKPIGNVSLMYIDYTNKFAELGIMIGEKDYWNRGFGTDAILTMMGFGFDTVGLNRIELRVNADNTRGIACYKKCGFRYEGKRKQRTFHEGKYKDELMMSVLRKEFDARRKRGN